MHMHALVYKLEFSLEFTLYFTKYWMKTLLKVYGLLMAVFGDNNVYVDGPYSSGGRFSLLPQGPLASELQMEHLTPSDVEADGADPSISASRCPSPELQ